MEFLIKPSEWYVPERISQSALKSWGNCPAKYFYEYQLSLSPVSDDLSNASQGRLFHFLMDDFFTRIHGNGFDTGQMYSILDQGILEWQKENMPDFEKVALAQEVDAVAVEISWLNSCEQTFNIVWNFLVMERFFEDYVTVASEYHTYLNMGSWEFHGYVDLIARNLITGMIEVIDFKMVRAMSDYEARLMDYQLPLYVRAVSEQFGYDLDKIHGSYWQVKNAVPKLPSLNKDGTMSRRNITTTWEVYQGALLSAGLDPADYEDMRDKLSDKESVNYWQMKLVYSYSPLVMAHISSAASRQADAILAACNNHGPFPPIMNYNCRSCAFKDLCIAFLYDMDAEHVIETKFHHKEH